MENFAKGLSDILRYAPNDAKRRYPEGVIGSAVAHVDRMVVVIERREQDSGPHFNYQMYVRDPSDYQASHQEEIERRELEKAYFRQKELMRKKK